MPGRGKFQRNTDVREQSIFRKMQIENARTERSMNFLHVCICIHVVGAWWCARMFTGIEWGIEVIERYNEVLARLYH